MRVVSLLLLNHQPGFNRVKELAVLFPLNLEISKIASSGIAHYRIKASFQLEKTCKILKSNR